MLTPEELDSRLAKEQLAKSFREIGKPKKKADWEMTDEEIDDAYQQLRDRGITDF